MGNSSSPGSRDPSPERYPGPGEREPRPGERDPLPREGGSGSGPDPGSRDDPIPFREQRFELIRRECLRDRRLFVDRTFPADATSLGSMSVPGVQWVRATQLFKHPQFFIDSFSTTDIVQGSLGDCWFLAAMSSLTLDANLFNYVVPNDQSFQENYAGIFHFRFWQFGRWVEVVVDDFLPTQNQHLIFTASSTWRELWSALLEKAYAKLHGSYSILSGGRVSEAMEDFTGGIAVSMEMANTKPKELWYMVKQALNKQTMISCSIEADSSGEMETKRPLGLLAGHAYSIVAADKVSLSNAAVKLFRLRNPWGRKEYNGPWSDRSTVWNEVSQEEKIRLKLKFNEEGEFWIPANILVEQFSDVELCSHDPMCDHNKECVWGITNHEGMWMAGISAGGNLSKDTFSRNPQYRLQLLEEDEESHGGSPACTIAVQLLQKDGRKTGSTHLYIAFQIFAVPKWHEDRSAPFGRKFFNKEAVFESGNYINTRAISRRTQLPPGQYVIVPSTFNQNEERGFFLRIFARKANLSRENARTINDFDPTINRTETDGATAHRRNSEILREVTDTSTTLSAPEFMTVFNSG
ncbi:calpain-3-like [Amblyraja radiata]|uniref:calpain-3-like n=1 Tax=Amblyraja radiata TaxID=386614 RepID=UPI001403C048|nr:calpain-3-like [Amblyraja radiata]